MTAVSFIFYLYFSDKSRSSRRAKAAEARDDVDTSSCQRCVTSDPSPGASKPSRLKERLTLSGCSQPHGLKPRPPSMPRVRAQLSPPSRTLSPGSSTAYRNDSTPVKKRDVAVTAGRTNAPLSSQKPQSQKEPTSKAVPANDEVDRSVPSLDHRGVRKAQRVLPNVRCQKESVRRNEAARIIQRAWRRCVMHAHICTCGGS